MPLNINEKRNCYIYFNLKIIIKHFIIMHLLLLLLDFRIVHIRGICIRFDLFIHFIIGITEDISIFKTSLKMLIITIQECKNKTENG